jgi:predicted NBD/HSP70 family sugar kinase
LFIATYTQPYSGRGRSEWALLGEGVTGTVLGQTRSHVPPRGTLRPEELKRNNMGRLLTRVHLRGATSRAALTKDLGLNRSTIGDLTSSLVELGLVSEGGSVSPRGNGRPSYLVWPREDVTVIGVNVGVDRTIVANVGLGGELLSRRERPHHRGQHEMPSVVESLAQMIEDALREGRGARCVGIGVAVPGAVALRDGVVRFAPNLGWVDEPFSAALSSRLGMSVVCDNDANLGARAEHLRGVAVGRDNIAYLSGSVGLGGGFILGGQPLTGARGFAGEVGHLLVAPDGEPCRCGNAGCWETKISENRLLTLAGRLPGGGPEAVQEVFGFAAGGEQRASQALDDIANWIAVGLRAVINIFNPEMIVFGDSLALIWQARATQIDARLSELPMISPIDHLSIVTSKFGQDAPLVGAAELAFTGILADPASIADLTTPVPPMAMNG